MSGFLTYWTCFAIKKLPHVAYNSVYLDDDVYLVEVFIKLERSDLKNKTKLHIRIRYNCVLVSYPGLTNATLCIDYYNFVSVSIANTIFTKQIY